MNETKQRVAASLVCGLAFAVTVVLCPVVHLFLSNEGEFWFTLGDIAGQVLALTGAVAFVLAAVHFFLPGKSKIPWRLLFASVVCALALGAYVQNQFMSSYLPLLTGDRIDWGAYPGWNAGSWALWLGSPAFFAVFAITRPAPAKKTVYGILAFLFLMQTLACAIELAAAKHENRKGSAFFSKDGLYDTSEAGNVVVLVSDTFEGTYMNEILERFPEYKDILSDCTCYDNVTGLSVFTYFSMATLLSGRDFPLGKGSQGGFDWCLENQTIVDRVKSNNWDVSYYSKFSPTGNLSSKISNYADGIIKPHGRPSWTIAALLWRSSLFRSVPHPLKRHFIVYADEFEAIRQECASRGPFPYVMNDTQRYKYVSRVGLEKTGGNPQYKVIHLNGCHNPVKIDEAFRQKEYGEETPEHERMIVGAKASLNLLRQYLDALKKAGTYDDTTVIMTADHGFNMRFYPVFVVKEARRGRTGFAVDSSPLSLLEDYEDIVVQLTSGKTFSEIVAGMDLDSARVRKALDYRSENGQYGGKTNKKTTVSISGPASREESYSCDRDEFLLAGDFSGNYRSGDPIIQKGAPAGRSAKVYGVDGEGNVFGHSAVLDVAFESAKSRAPALHINLRNKTGIPQRVKFLQDGREIAIETLGPDETREMRVDFPEKTGNRWTLELNVPDARKCHAVERILGWTEYSSIAVEDAKLVEN